MVFAWLILEAVGDSMLTRLRKEKNFKNWVFKLFPQWIHFHQSIFPIMCWHLWERREGSRVIKWRFEFPHTDLQMFWWLTVLKQNDPGRKHMWMGKPPIWGYTDEPNYLRPFEMLILVVLFTRPVFQATDMIIELAPTVWPVVTCLLGTMVIWSFGQWSNTRRGGILPTSAVLYQDVLFAFHHGLFGSTYCVGRFHQFVIFSNPNITLK